MRHIGRTHSVNIIFAISRTLTIDKVFKRINAHSEMYILLMYAQALHLLALECECISIQYYNWRTNLLYVVNSDLDYSFFYNNTHFATLSQ